jgi:ADP-ribose pyrophosphatase
MTPTLTARDVELRDRTTVYQGYFRIARYRVRHKLFEGGWSGDIVREVFERGHAVAVLPYDPDADRVVMIEQFRIGAFSAIADGMFGADASPWLIECVAGIAERGEDPETVARREIQEETGCDIDLVVPVHHYLVSPGGTSETVSIYCGRVDSGRVNGIHGLSHEGENIRPFAISVAEAFRNLDDGRVCNAMTIIALQWLRANREYLRQAWRRP